ncbi:MAG: hypothetical protein KH842_11580 [Firmicutes bacterium]|nr:hypothetical protein [Bacillota bacterium]
MDDIRNTSALFVGGQDTAPHTERTARELWQLLFQKTENEMAGYMNRLDQLSRDELIQAADEQEDDFSAAAGEATGTSE